MIPFKAVLEDPSVVIVDEHSPHKLMQGYWYFDTPFFRSGGRKFLSLLALIWRSWRSVSCPGVGALSAVPASRRSVGCPGVSGAVRRCPALSGAVPRCPDAQSAPTNTITNPRPE